MSKINYTIVTSIFDIKKYHPGCNRWRSTERYIELFGYINDLNLKTVLFIDAHLKDKISPREGLIIIPYNLEDLPSYKKIKDLEGLRPVGNGPHVNKMFTSVITDKFYLMKLAISHTSSTHLIWMDSGISHLGIIPREEFISNIQTLIFPDKITVYLMKAIHPDEIKDLANHLQYSKGKIAATLSIFPVNMINWYVSEINELFDYTINELKLMCFEEQFMGVILAKYPDKFDFFYGDYVGILKNLKYVTTNIHIVIQNLVYCRDKKLNDTGYKIILKLIESISQSKTHIDYSNFCELCYNAQILCFYVDKELSIYFGHMLGFLYHNTPDGHKYVTTRYNNIKDNLSFVGLNLDNNEYFNEKNIIELDTHDLLWSIM
jgi:hypothetical protein